MIRFGIGGIWIARRAATDVGFLPRSELQGGCSVAARR